MHKLEQLCQRFSCVLVTIKFIHPDGEESYSESELVVDCGVDEYEKALHSSFGPEDPKMLIIRQVILILNDFR